MNKVEELAGWSAMIFVVALILVNGWCAIQGKPGPFQFPTYVKVIH